MAVVLATTTLVPVLVVVIPVVAMMFLIMRNVLAVIPVVIHKEDPLAAGVVLMAVPTPVSCVASGHVQVDRRAVTSQYGLMKRRTQLNYANSEGFPVRPELVEG